MTVDIEKITFSINGNLKDKIEDLIEQLDYKGMSDIICAALREFHNKYGE